MKSSKLVAPVIGALLIALAAQAAAQAGRPAAPRAAAEGVVNVNTASEEQLTLLPNVGPTRARAIITARERRPFRTVQELQRVRGIGWATMRRLRPYVTVSGETTLRQAIPARSAPRAE